MAGQRIGVTDRNREHGDFFRTRGLRNIRNLEIKARTRAKLGRY